MLSFPQIVSGNPEFYLCGVSPSRDEVLSPRLRAGLLFRRKDPKPFSPVRGPPPPRGQALRVPGLLPRIMMAAQLTPRCKATSPLKQCSPKGSIRGSSPATLNALDGFNIPQFEMITVHSVRRGASMSPVVILDILYRGSRFSVSWDSLGAFRVD